MLHHLGKKKPLKEISGVIQDSCDKAGTEKKLFQARLLSGPFSQKCPLFLLPEDIFRFCVKPLGLQLEFSQNPKIISWSFSVLQPIPKHTVNGNLGCNYIS